MSSELPGHWFSAFMLKHLTALPIIYDGKRMKVYFLRAGRCVITYYCGEGGRGGEWCGMTGSAWKCTSCVLDVMLLLIITEGRGAGEGRGAAFFSSAEN